MANRQQDLRGKISEKLGRMRLKWTGETVAATHIVLSPQRSLLQSAHAPPTRAAVRTRLPAVKLGTVAPRSQSETEEEAEWSDGVSDDLLAGAVVVDVEGFFHPAFELWMLDFPALDTLRLCPDAAGSFTPYAPFHCDTLVLFPSTDDDANRAYMLDSDRSGGEDEDALPLAVDPLEYALPTFADVPPSTARIVVNLGGRGASPVHSFRLLAGAWEHVQEVVVIVPRYIEGGAEIDMFPATYDVVEMMRSPKAIYTFVGREVEARMGTWEGFMDDVRQGLADLIMHEAQPDVDYAVQDDAARDLYAGEREAHQAESGRLRRERALASLRTRDNPEGGFHHPASREWVLANRPRLHTMAKVLPRPTKKGLLDEEPDYEEEVQAILKAEEPTLWSLEGWIEARLSHLQFINMGDYKARDDIGKKVAALHVYQ